MQAIIKRTSRNIIRIEKLKKIIERIKYGDNIVLNPKDEYYSIIIRKLPLILMEIPTLCYIFSNHIDHIYYNRQHESQLANIIRDLISYAKKVYSPYITSRLRLPTVKLNYDKFSSYSNTELLDEYYSNRDKMYIYYLNKLYVKNCTKCNNSKNFIEDFVSTIKNDKLNICNSDCMLYDGTMVVLETNIKHVNDKADVCIIGINPGREEAEQNRPFIGRAGQKMRPNLDNLVAKYNLKYLITNAALCHSSNASNIDDRTLINCSSKFLSRILDTFCNENTVIIMMGNQVNNALCGEKVKANGNTKVLTNRELLGKKYKRILLTVHPSYLIRRGNKICNCWDTCWQYLDNYFSIRNMQQKDHSDQDINKLDNSFGNEKNNSALSRPINTEIDDFDKDYILFDIKVKDNKVYYILIHSKTWEKKIVVKPLKFPVFVKTGRYIDCPFFESINNFDYVVYLNREEVDKIRKLLLFSSSN